MASSHQGFGQSRIWDAFNATPFKESLRLLIPGVSDISVDPVGRFLVVKLKHDAINGDPLARPVNGIRRYGTAPRASGGSVPAADALQ